MARDVSDILSSLSVSFPGGKDVSVMSPADGSVLITLAADTPQTLNHKIDHAKTTQALWQRRARSEREQLLTDYAAALKAHREMLADIITQEGGKTVREALAEVDGSADILLKTIRDASLAEFGGMARMKERPAVGIVGLITSFNFPIAVAHWTIAPALLAGNGVIWKPSEKTPLVALACKAIFDRVAGDANHLLAIIVGGRAIGEALVVHEAIDMISATGSVGMGKSIKKTLAAKKNNQIHPILELGGNNGAIISEHVSKSHLEWSINAILTSFLGSTGQRCTNTRRLFIHRHIYDSAVQLLTQKIEQFLKDNPIQSPHTADNDYGYAALIDKDAFERFERAQKLAREQGGKILFGKRIASDAFKDGYYVEPALALMPKQTEVMFEETFAPLLYVTPYDGEIEAAIALVNAPGNAGLVGAIYTQRQEEADHFASLNQSGHTLINSPKGTGTPAYGMGFGGTKDSGEGEILNAADPLKAFTRQTHFTRVAQYKDVAMDL